MKFIKNDKIKFAIVAVIYLLWTIWVGNYWLLLGLPIIFDMYITKKVNWTFWKKREGKNSKAVEWLDAIIFAVIAVTLINIYLFQNYKIPTGSMEKSLLIGDHLFVSKVSYGPRIPNTPIAFPFSQHTLPFTKSTPSFLEWIKWPYKRIAGLGEVKNGDPVVFNFPEGDTVIIEQSNSSYYAIVRQNAYYLMDKDRADGVELKSEAQYTNIARNLIKKNYHVVSRPVDRTDNYIKRCVAIHGDKFQVKDGMVYINDKMQDKPENLQFIYFITTNGTPLNSSSLSKMGIYKSDVMNIGGGRYQIPLTDANAKKLKELSYVVSVERYISQPEFNPDIFPHSADYGWSLDNFGPFVIPEKDATVELNTTNLCLYKRLIETYENNKLEVKDSTIFINGEVAKSYTFKMDYFFMMGDNRHMSLDSRYWGLVPMDHVVGKPLFIWLSLDKEKSFPSNIRWNRMFMSAK
ncbi:MAG: S26 family signal peptidase [Bacteroidales bacterium]|nr:S26 family signal peptidase [Bacteroidales bacterium]